MEYVQDYIDTKLHCIDLDYFDTMGVTPLQWASLNGDKDVVEALLKAKADPTLKDTVENMTAYDLAKRELDEAKDDEEKKKKYEPLVALLKGK